MKKGKVFLVGAGPGDPGLITVRGLECLRKADVIIYDNLCNPFLLREVRKGAEVIFAGKHSGSHTIEQDRIEHLMVRFASKGKMVVRLKGGDPFVFGRGAEEAATLKRHGVGFEIVPGVTSGIAVPAYAGIPATHRDHASGVALVTAHENPKKSESLLDYHSLANFSGTLMFLMGVKRLRHVTEGLINCGKDSETPAALVRWGTRGIQEVLEGTLEDIAEKAETRFFFAPSVFVVGDVVRCRPLLRWFEQRPLFGRRIVITRSREQNKAFADSLHELGAEVIEFPTVEIQGVERLPLLKQIHNYDWIVFSSSWGVKFFLDAVIKQYGDLRVLKGIKLAVVGSETAASLKERGLKAAVQPGTYSSAGLLREFKKRKILWKGQRVLLPRSEIGRDVIEKELKRLGAKVQALTVYRNILPKLTWELDALHRIGADFITFASPSAVANFIKIIKKSKMLSELNLLKTARLVSIGPVTSSAIRKKGLRVHAEAKVHTSQSLLETLQKMPFRKPESSRAEVLKWRKLKSSPKFNL